MTDPSAGDAGEGSERCRGISPRPVFHSTGRGHAAHLFTEVTV